MGSTFKEVLNGINSQWQILGDLDEKAVEFAVILPLLQQLGWNTTDVTEVYPQRKLTNNHRPDFDLQVGGQSRAVVEVKKWAADLNPDNERQLQGYCQEVGPSVAALTNGHRWWLYIGPWKRPRGGALRPFLDFDIGDDPEEAESYFRDFLARENLTSQQDVNRTVKAAKDLRGRQERRVEVMRRLTEVWNDLASNEPNLVEVVKTLAEHNGIHPRDRDIEEFIRKSGSLVNQISHETKKQGADRSKPKSFVVKKAGQEPVFVEVKDWTDVRLGVCKLMLARDEHGFRQFVSKRPELFRDVPFHNARRIDQTDIFVPPGGTRQHITKVCYEILAEFGYAQECLEIQMQGG